MSTHGSAQLLGSSLRFDWEWKGLPESIIVLTLGSKPMSHLPCFHDSNTGRFTEWWDLIYLLWQHFGDESTAVGLLQFVGESRSPFYEPSFLEEDRETPRVNGNRVAMLVIRKVFSHLTYHHVNRTRIDVSHSNTLHHFFLAITLVYGFGNRDSAVLPVFLDDIPCMANTSNSSLCTSIQIMRFPNYIRISPPEKKLYWTKILKEQCEGKDLLKSLNYALKPVNTTYNESYRTKK